MDVNRHLLIGNLGDDPMHFNDPDMTEMTVFSIATTLKFQNANGQQVEGTEWHRIVAFGWRASVAQQFRKGQRVFVEGYVRSRQYEKEGQLHNQKEVVAQFLHQVEVPVRDSESPPSHPRAAVPPNHNADRSSPAPERSMQNSEAQALF